VNVSVSLKTASLDAYKANLDKITLVVGKAAADVEANAKASIATNSGQYREYRSGKDNEIVHWSSPPGTPPNSDTGNLVTEDRAGGCIHIEFNLKRTGLTGFQRLNDIATKGRDINGA